jgi:aminoglycoside phosphotransferase (APT) family kinase protein
MPKGALLGVGRTAEVYAWAPGLVLKLYRSGFPRDWVAHEARLGRLVHAAGQPAPAVGELVEVEGRSGYLCERLQGPSMLDALQRRPWRAGGAGRELARLHLRIHRSAAPPELPSLAEQLARNIRHPRSALGDLAERVVTVLETLPAGEALCHYDFHPGNVLGVGDGARVIDWPASGRGAAAADVARTLVLLESPYLPEGFPSVLRPVALGLKRWIASAYLAEYQRGSGLARSDVLSWRVPVAAARLWEQVPGEREWLLGMVRRGLDP